MDVAEAQKRIDALCRRFHPHCVVCGREQGRPPPLSLRLRARDDGGVSATFACSAAYTGYEGFVHGGTLASLMDGAMVHCLFAHGLVAYTAELVLRYRRPVRIGVPAEIRAWLEKPRGRVRVLVGEIRQEAQVAVTARGKFLAPASAARIEAAPCDAESGEDSPGDAVPADRPQRCAGDRHGDSFVPVEPTDSGA